MNTVQALLASSTHVLSQQGIPRARWCAEMLLAHVLKVKKGDLFLTGDRPLSGQEVTAFHHAIEAKARKEPLEYLLQEVEFYHCLLSVTPDVLIPRQETEILLDLVCSRLKGSETGALDLCTGSGCLAIGLKKAVPKLGVVGVDLCPRALKVACANGKKNGVEVEWHLGDLLGPVAGQKFDLVLCNPPYISEGEFLSLEDEVRLFEPKKALVGGKTGLEFFERLALELPAFLRPGAQVFFEIGTGQKEALLSLFSKSCWHRVQVEPDWAGHDRFFSSIFLENE